MGDNLKFVDTEHHQQYHAQGPGVVGSWVVVVTHARATNLRRGVSLCSYSPLPVIGWHMHSLGTGKFCRFCWSERIHSEISDHGIVAVVKHYIFRLEVAMVYLVAMQKENAIDELADEMARHCLRKGTGLWSPSVHRRKEIVKKIPARGVLRHDSCHALRTHLTGLLTLHTTNNRAITDYAYHVHQILVIEAHLHHCLHLCNFTIKRIVTAIQDLDENGGACLQIIAYERASAGSAHSLKTFLKHILIGQDTANQVAPATRAPLSAKHLLRYRLLRGLGRGCPLFLAILA
mmetsp:Transcript_21467/g.40900  ORF Transcript_21467/g.40900 Transcript_21467/m.40900 type:complete len:290 (+) Transcript_21467:2332-3201(+)